jgi:endonuclease-3
MPLDAGAALRPKLREVREVHHRLRRLYGPRPRRRERQEILDALIATLLSQNTSDTNSARAFASLKARFSDWDAVRRAPVGAIRSCIRSGGLAGVKAPRIRAILREIHAERGETSLEHLRRASAERIKETLSRLPGVGPKTVACVLLFGLGRPDFPVDTHVHRVVRRLGWVPPKSSAEAAYRHLSACLPGKRMHELHVLMVNHGRQLCRARVPRCPECPIRAVCDAGSTRPRARA